MKRIGWSVLFILMPFMIMGQSHVPEVSDYKDFMESKTLVLLDDNPMSSFNLVIKDVMENTWDITPYEFISNAEFDKLRHDSDHSFLLVTKAHFDKDRTKARYDFLSLIMGEHNTRVADMPDLCSLPLAYYKVEDDTYTYKMEAFVRFLQNHVRRMLEDPSLIGKKPFKYYNKNMTEKLEDKTLYLIKSDLGGDVDTEAEIRDVYPYDFELVEREDVKQAIAERKEDVVFLHKVGPEKTRLKARVYKILVGAGDPNIYYFDYRMARKSSHDAFEKRDFRKIR